MKISKKWALAVLLTSGLALGSCASIYQKDAEPAAPMADKPIEVTHETCKAMMKGMHEKMKSDGMDKAAMKKKMMAGEGMTDTQKQCHKMMHAKHKKMHAEKKKMDHSAMSQGEMKKHKHSGEHKKMVVSDECKAKMKKMKAKMKSGEMDMAAMKAKMKSKSMDDMTDEQKQCNKVIKNKMKKKMHKKKHEAEKAAKAAEPAHEH